MRGSRLGALAIAVIAGVAAVVVVRRRRRDGRAPDVRGDAVPKDPRPQAELVDLASEESFPASDPPSYWGRDPAGD